MSEVGASVVAFQGMHGAYSEAIALQTVPGCQPRPCEQFETAFQVSASVLCWTLRVCKLLAGSHAWEVSMQDWSEWASKRSGLCLTVKQDIWLVLCML